MKRFLSHLVFIIKTFLYYFIPIRKKTLLRKNLLYYSQWESKQLVRDILEGKISATDDPKWRLSGAKSKEEYLHWSWNGCGMACLKIIVKHATGREVPLVVLGKQCEMYGGYKRKKFTSTNYKNSIDGLFYKPFIKFIQNEFDLSGRVNSFLTIKEIILATEKGDYVIVSVSPRIRNREDKPVKKGGHLVLITGYDIREKCLYLHNPSGFYKESQEYYMMSFIDFEKFFAHRGMILSVTTD